MSVFNTEYMGSGIDRPGGEGEFDQLRTRGR